MERVSDTFLKNQYRQLLSIFNSYLKILSSISHLFYVTFSSDSHNIDNTYRYTHIFTYPYTSRCQRMSILGVFRVSFKLNKWKVLEQLWHSFSQSLNRYMESENAKMENTDASPCLHGNQCISSDCRVWIGRQSTKFDKSMGKVTMLTYRL